MLAVFEHDSSDIPYPFAIYIYSTMFDFLENAGLTFSESHHISIGHYDAALFRDSDQFGKPGMLYKMPVLSMYREKPVRLDKIQDQLQLFPAGVARYMDFRDVFMKNLGSTAVEMIYEIRDGFFVSRDEP